MTMHALPPSHLTRDELMTLKAKALRRKAWFKLSRLERAIVNLTIKVVEKARSSTLAKAITQIAMKLHSWISNRKTFKERALEAGSLVAERVVEAGLKLGVKNAYEWLNDKAYVFYLGVAYLNTPRIYGFGLA